MTKSFYPFLLLLFFACNNNSNKTSTKETITDSIVNEKVYINLGGEAQYV